MEDKIFENRFLDNLFSPTIITSIEIKDNGVKINDKQLQIEQEQVAYYFEPFFRDYSKFLDLLGTKENLIAYKNYILSQSNKRDVYKEVDFIRERIIHSLLQFEKKFL